MKAPQEKSVAYTATVVVVAIIIFVVISWIPRAFITYPTPGMHMPDVTNEAPQKMKEAANEMQEAAKKMQDEMMKQTKQKGE
jgi:cytoskeletal protein RodZ